MTEKESTRWLAVFESFIKLLRIDSKEIAATDDRGSPLNLWRSQKRCHVVAEKSEVDGHSQICIAIPRTSDCGQSIGYF